MKTDNNYSYILRCPTTLKPLTDHQRCYSGGICPHCGHNDRSTFTHHEKLVGKWVRPSFWEYLRGHRKYFQEKT